MDLALALVLPGLAALPTAASPALKHVDVYSAGEAGYASYRIPAIEVTHRGVVLAFAEARRNNAGDPGTPGNEIDLVLKRSTDGGKTWSGLHLIEHAGAGWSSANAATVVDRATRRVWVLYLRSRPGRGTEAARPGTDDFQTHARYSDDDGATWSEPTDLTAAARDLADPAWRATVIGPGGGIQTRSGRLLIAAWKSEPYEPFAFYSDDHGKTWRRGEDVPDAVGGNECQVVELSNGAIAMDIRQNSGPHRWLAVSNDGGATWSAPRPGATVTPVMCAIERAARRSGGRGRSVIAWTGPRGPGRAGLVLRLSTDETATFGAERLLYDGPAAYSDLAPLRGGALGVLWERDNYTRITFTRLPRELWNER